MQMSTKYKIHTANLGQALLIISMKAWDPSLKGLNVNSQ